MRTSYNIVLGLTVLSASLFGAPTHLRVVGSWGSLSMYQEFEKPFWKKEFVKEFPNTKVRLSSLGQVKLKGPAVYRELAKGVFDVVSTVGDYVVSDSQAIAGLDLPMLTSNIETARKIADSYHDTLDEALKKDFNAKLLGVAPYPAQVLFCKDKMTSLQDLKGRKIRASGASVAVFLESIGATGVTMSYSEVPQALQRGVIDCAVTGGLSGYQSGWGEVSKYLYPLAIGGWDYVITAMNLDTWNKFTIEEQKKLLISIKTNLTDPSWTKTAYETSEGEKCLTGQECSYGKAASMILVKVKDTDKAFGKETLIKKVIPEWVKKVSPAVVKEWNDSIGKIVHIEAK